jgi:Holliday junction resolvase
MGTIRRSRGYSYEHSLVQRLNNKKDWHARRLGGSSTGLPDIIAVNNKKAILLTIEAKSGTGDILYVPQEQIERCILISEMFSYYKTRHVILAFKFMRKKRLRRKGKVTYEQRKLMEYYKLADPLYTTSQYPIVKCLYDGTSFAIYKDKADMIKLQDYVMPFKGQPKSNIRI